jgi:hypothetical protein
MSISYGGWGSGRRRCRRSPAEKVRYAYTYAYRGDYYDVQGDLAAAAAEYRRAIAVAPWLQKAKDGLARVSRSR